MYAPDFAVADREILKNVQKLEATVVLAPIKKAAQFFKN
jgi:hypothetical protein